MIQQKRFKLFLDVFNTFSDKLKADAIFCYDYKVFEMLASQGKLDIITHLEDFLPEAKKEGVATAKRYPVIRAAIRGAHNDIFHYYFGVLDKKDQLQVLKVYDYDCLKSVISNGDLSLIKFLFHSLTEEQIHKILKSSEYKLLHYAARENQHNIILYFRELAPPEIF